MPKVPPASLSGRVRSVSNHMAQMFELTAHVNPVTKRWTWKEQLRFGGASPPATVSGWNFRRLCLDSHPEPGNLRVVLKINQDPHVHGVGLQHVCKREFSVSGPEDPQESVDEKQSASSPNFSRTVEKNRILTDRRRRSVSLNKQSAVLHDLLTVPGIGPRNMEKFVAKGIEKVAELKQLYKDKVS